MPRIDPLQLLKCLSVLLSPVGGIKSKDEVHRLASLMTKFSKKLVSKCIYVQILRTTETELLGMFMGAGGWNLAHQWLSDAILAQNLPFIRELLELLIMCPVDVERLKANNFPKLIKNLTKESSNENVRQLASQLVDQWLRVVKGLPAVTVAVPSNDLIPLQASILYTQEVPAQSSFDSVAAVEPCEPMQDIESYSEEFVPEASDTNEVTMPAMESEAVEDDETDGKVSEEDTSAWDGPPGILPVYKITIRDGKQVLAKVNTGERAPRKQTFSSATLKQDIPRISTNIIPKRSAEAHMKKKGSAVDASSAKTKSVKSEANVDVKKITKDIQKKLLEKSLTEKKMKLIEPSKEKPSDAFTDKERAKERKERELNKLKDKKVEKTVSIAEKVAAQAEKDKATLAKLIPPPISKLGKIPKKPRVDEDSKSGDAKKTGSDDKKSSDHKKSSPQSNDSKKSSSSSSSQDGRKSSSSHGRPKTVKSFNSKFRSTGLEEDIKPPSKPSRRSNSSSSSEKKSSKPDLKRSSPVKDGFPPEKKPKVEKVEPPAEEVKKVEKPPPAKPKRIVLQESDMFMDALTASTKMEPRKRKRRTSNSKDGVEVKKEPGTKDGTPPGSPNSEDNMSPLCIKSAPKFYRDTLESADDENEEKPKINIKVEEPGTNDTAQIKESSSPNEDDSEDVNEDEKSKKSSAEDDRPGKEAEIPADTAETTLKGVLVIHKTRKGAKKCVRWKVETELLSIKYFELDETERVNVTKTFTDMKQMERTTEREGFQLSRKLAQDDNMEEKTSWKHPVLIDIPPPIVQWGEKSKEKDVQYARESSVLSALYFNRSSIPDSAGEPDVEMHPAKDPTVIPLDDTTGNPEGVIDFRGKPWPEPKPMLPPTSPTVNMFPPQQPAGPFMPFPGAGPGFNAMGPMYQQGPGMMVPNGGGPVPMGGDWRTGDGRVVAMDNTAPMDMYNQQGGPAMGMGMPGVMGPGPMGPMDVNYSMMPNDDMSQYPMQGYPMPGPMFQQFRGPGPMGPNMNRGRGGGPRGQWFRPNGAPNGSWQGQGGRGGGRPWLRGVCHQFASRGSCRQGSKCTYSH